MDDGNCDCFVSRDIQLTSHHAIQCLGYAASNLLEYVPSFGGRLMAHPMVQIVVAVQKLLCF